MDETSDVAARLDQVLCEPLLPIRSDADLDLALRKLFFLEDNGGTAKDPVYVRSLAVLIADYEQKHFGAEPADPVAIVQARMADMGISQADLARDANIQPSHLSEMLNGKRSLGLNARIGISNALRLPIELLIPEGYPADTRTVEDQSNLSTAPMEKGKECYSEIEDPTINRVEFTHKVRELSARREEMVSVYGDAKLLCGQAFFNLRLLDECYKIPDTDTVLQHIAYVDQVRSTALNFWYTSTCNILVFWERVMSAATPADLAAESVLFLRSQHHGCDAQLRQLTASHSLLLGRNQQAPAASMHKRSVA